MFKEVFTKVTLCMSTADVVGDVYIYIYIYNNYVNLTEGTNVHMVLYVCDVQSCILDAMIRGQIPPLRQLRIR